MPDSSGQMSFDVMFAVVVALVTVQAFVPLTIGIADAQNAAVIRAQEKAIARDLARVIITVEGLGSGGSETYGIDYTIPEIYASGLRAGIGCDITVDDVGNTITVTVGTGHYPGLETGAVIEGSVSATGMPAVAQTLHCGQTITISEGGVA